jgi:hypothetical protein
MEGRFGTSTLQREAPRKATALGFEKLSPRAAALQPNYS